MNFVFLIEVLATVFMAWLLASQVLAPFLQGRPMFPMFGRMPKLQQELSQAKQARDEQEIEKEIAVEKSKLNPKE